MVDSNNGGWSRRDYLRKTGATAPVIAGLAGCTGDDSSGGGGDGGTGDGGGGSSGGSGTSAGSTDGSGNADTLIWMTGASAPRWREFWTKTITEFTKETGIPVQMEYTGHGVSSYERMTTLIQSGSPPSIMHGNHLGANGILYSEGFLNPIDDVVGEMEGKYGSAPEALKMKPFGTNHMLATETLIYCEWYRNDKYDFKDFSQKEILNQAPKVDSEQMRATQVAAAPTGVSGANMLTGGCVSGADVITFDSNNEATFVMDQDSNRDIFVDQLKFMKNLHQYSDNGSDCSWGCASGGYANGSFAHVWYAGGRAGMAATDENPEHARKSSPRPITAMNGEHRTPVLPQQYGHGVFNADVIGEDQVQNAKDLLRFVFMDRERYLEYLSLTPLHKWPPFGDMAQSSEYKNLSAFQENPETMGKWLEIWNNQFMNNIKMGGEVGRAFPYYGPTRQTNIPAEIVHEVIVNDADPATEFDNRMPDLKSEFQEIKKKIDSEVK
jgi:hypothetical protein